MKVRVGSPYLWHLTFSARAECRDWASVGHLITIRHRLGLSIAAVETRA